MLWDYVRLDDDTQIAYSAVQDDGTVKIAVERPIDFDFDHAECSLPGLSWHDVSGFTPHELEWLSEFIRSNSPLIFELAERRSEGGKAVA